MPDRPQGAGQGTPSSVDHPSCGGQPVWLAEDWQQRWRDKDPFEQARALQGQVFRNKEGRRTLRFECEKRGFFLKLHEGIGWAEIFKNLLQGRLPVLGAANEYFACRKLAELGVDTMTPVAFGVRGSNPAKQLSFLITEALDHTISLEDYCKSWQEQPPSLREKRALIRRLARISRTLHGNGINHRDYYLCHFLRRDDGIPFAENDPLFLIDLHRVQMRVRTPLRWIIKDIAGLYYSAFALPLTRRDVIAFLAIYQPAWLQPQARPVLQKIVQRAEKLYLKDFARPAPASIRAINAFVE